MLRKERKELNLERNCPVNHTQIIAPRITHIVNLLFKQNIYNVIVPNDYVSYTAPEGFEKTPPCMYFGCMMPERELFTRGRERANNKQLLYHFSQG